MKMKTGRKALSRDERKLAALVVTEGRKALGDLIVGERKLADSLGAEGYVTLRTGEAKEGRKAVLGVLGTVERLAALLAPVALAAAEARRMEAAAAATAAEAQLITAQTRCDELEVKKRNAETEALKASALRH